MSYEEKFEPVATSLINHCKECVIDGYNNGMFESWLDIDADLDFGHAYEKAFKEHFGDLITAEITARFFFAGKNIIYAIKSYLFLKENRYNLNELLKFVENFVSWQLSEFGNDYAEFDVSSWLYDDGDEEQQMDDPI
jgi:hypothetical protein